MDLKGDLTQSCERIMDKIKISEDQILKSLDNLFENMPNQVFKTIRRALPGK